MSEQSESSSLQRAWLAIARRPDPLTSVAYTLPVFLAYQLGSVWIDRRSPLDFVSSWLLRLLDANVQLYMGVIVALALALLIVAWAERRQSKQAPSSLGRVLVEALVGAAVVLVALGWTSHRMLRTSQTSAIAHYGVLDKLVLAAGSGFHEELLFRVGLLSGGTWVLHKLLELTPNAALLSALVISTFGFALMQDGGHFVLEVFSYRVLQAVVFSLLYLTRGFAVAVYAHTAYAALVYFVYA